MYEKQINMMPENAEFVTLQMARFSLMQQVLLVTEIRNRQRNKLAKLFNCFAIKSIDVKKEIDDFVDNMEERIKRDVAQLECVQHDKIITLVKGYVFAGDNPLFQQICTYFSQSVVRNMRKTRGKEWCPVFVVQAHTLQEALHKQEILFSDRYMDGVLQMLTPLYEKALHEAVGTRNMEYAADLLKVGIATNLGLNEVKKLATDPETAPFVAEAKIRFVQNMLEYRDPYMLDGVILLCQKGLMMQEDLRSQRIQQTAERSAEDLARKYFGVSDWRSLLKKASDDSPLPFKYYANLREAMIKNLRSKAKKEMMDVTHGTQAFVEKQETTLSDYPSFEELVDSLKQIMEILTIDEVSHEESSRT